MGRAAGMFSDVVLVTSDNPRSENPEEIIDQIQEGIIPDSKKKILRIPNREEAIAQALGLAERDDVVLVLGKGHEPYQIIGSQKNSFDDRLCAQKILRGAKRVHAG